MKDNINKNMPGGILAQGFVGWIRNSTILFVMILLGVFFSFISPYFFSASNIFDITRQISVLAIAAAGETFVNRPGYFFLSAGLRAKELPS